MIVAVLRTWDRVKVQVDAKTVLSSPCKCLKEIIPSNFGEEGLSRIDFDDPVGNWKSYPVQSSSCDLGKIFLGL